MAKEYTQDQISKALEKLPNELKEAFFSIKNTEHIENICEKYDVLDRSSDIAKYVGQVLLGLLTSDEFQAILDEEVGLKKDTAQKVNQEINQLIFNPVKTILKEKSAPKSAPALEKEIKRPPRKDIYREPIK
ncbi:hypothetical protein ES703_50113 [subsurface metagenome]